MVGKEIPATASLGKPILQQVRLADERSGIRPMKAPSTSTKIIITGLAILAASVLHYVTPHSRLLLHNLFQKLYYLPIIYAAVSFGWRGGLLAAVASTICYIPHILTWRHQPYYAMSQYAELILFFLVGATTGLLADQGRRRRQQLEATTKAVAGELRTGQTCRSTLGSRPVSRQLGARNSKPSGQYRGSDQYHSLTRNVRGDS